MGTLSREEARRVYDRIGAFQDSQAFYEDRALDVLIRHGDFGSARRVFEFGCGTGRLAARLLSDELPSDARYRGVDLSPTMVGLAGERLAAWGERASATLADGGPPAEEPAASCDRFVSTYVLDLLSEADMDAVLAHAHRMLEPGGLLCIVSLTTGAGPVSRAVAGVWSGLHGLAPALVGGCRPVDLAPRLSDERWKLRHHERVAPFAIPSEIVVAERRAAAADPSGPPPH